jgi:hypothetical protein
LLQRLANGFRRRRQQISQKRFGVATFDLLLIKLPEAQASPPRYDQGARQQIEGFQHELPLGGTQTIGCLKVFQHDALMLGGEMGRQADLMCWHSDPGILTKSLTSFSLATTIKESNV